MVADEQRKGWRLLWDGESQHGWSRPDDAATGRLVSNDALSDFELSFLFRIAEGAAGGIRYLANSEHGYNDGFVYRLVDDETHPDAQEGTNGDRTLGSAYGLIPPSNLSSPTETKGFMGTETWQIARVVVRGDTVQHWLNGFKIVEFSRGSQSFDALVSRTDHGAVEGFGKSPSGHIVILDDDGSIEYRSLKIREY